MKRIFLFGVLALTGCAPYAQTQIDLIDQTRRGVAMAQTNQATYARLADQLAKLQRAKLDDAFDADVRESKSLSPAWVIEHRQVYAAAVDALDQQRFNLQQGAKTAGDNLSTIDAALQRLRWLNAIPLSWLQQMSGDETPATTTQP